MQITILIEGGAGVGKTHVADIIARALAEHGLPGGSVVDIWSGQPGVNRRHFEPASFKVQS